MSNAPVFDTEFRTRLADLFAWRRDVRRFRRDPVDDDLLDRLLDLAQLAPSVGNSQPWRIFRIASDAKRAEIRENFLACNDEALKAFSSEVDTGSREENATKLESRASFRSNRIGTSSSEQQGERAALYARLKLEGIDVAPVQLAVFCDRATSQGHGLGSRTMPEMLDYSVVGMISTLWLAARAAGLGLGWVSILDPERVRTALGAPPHFRLIAYLCLGWPEKEHIEPELARCGWQDRTSAGRRVEDV